MVYPFRLNLIKREICMCVIHDTNLRELKPDMFVKSKYQIIRKMNGSQFLTRWVSKAISNMMLY